jgi:hypothetical protein
MFDVAFLYFLKCSNFFLNNRAATNGRMLKNQSPFPFEKRVKSIPPSTSTESLDGHTKLQQYITQKSTTETVFKVYVCSVQPLIIVLNKIQDLGMSYRNLEHNSSGPTSSIICATSGQLSSHPNHLRSRNSSTSLSIENSILHHSHRHHRFYAQQQPMKDPFIVSDAEDEDNEEYQHETMLKITGNTSRYDGRQSLDESQKPSSDSKRNNTISNTGSNNNSEKTRSRLLDQHHLSPTSNNSHFSRNEIENGIRLTYDGPTVQIRKEILVPSSSTALSQFVPQSQHHDEGSSGAARMGSIYFPRTTEKKDSTTPIPRGQNKKHNHEGVCTYYACEALGDRFPHEKLVPGDVDTIRESTTIPAQKRFLSMMMSQQREESLHQESRNHREDRVGLARKESNSLIRIMAGEKKTSGPEEAFSRNDTTIFNSSHKNIENPCFSQNQQDVLLNHQSHLSHQNHQSHFEPRVHSQDPSGITSSLLSTCTNNIIMNTTSPYYQNTAQQYHPQHLPFRSAGPTRDRVSSDDVSMMEQQPPIMEIRPRARSRAIAIQRSSSRNNEIDIPSEESGGHMYDYATWRMYHRIVDHRKSQRFHHAQPQSQHNLDDRSPSSSKNCCSVLIPADGDNNAFHQSNHHSTTFMMMLSSHHQPVDQSCSGSSSCSDDEIFDLEL